MSDLLNQASLVMVPSGYKEDTVYSVVPSDGSGDLSFTRASNGTRINSAGLVEVVAWNLVEQSETFDSVSWGKSAVAINTSIGTSGIQSNVADAPNGTLTADRVNFNLQSDLDLGLNQNYSSAIASQSFVSSIYVKGEGSNIGKQIKLRIKRSTGGTFVSVDTTITLTADWVQITSSALTLLANNTGVFYIISSNDATNALIWGAQLNIGSTAKPYFPTTDRLNVPRLTYQNGGGGCPSLLLEPQRTNLCTYSQDFSNAVWNTIVDSGCSVTITPNYTTASNGLPAARLVASRTSTSTLAAIVNYAPNTGTTATKSIWMKNNNSGNVTIMFGDEAVTITDSWERYFVTNTYIYSIVGLRYSGVALSCDISITGSQFEVGAYPTSYIPTTSSSATRVIDDCRKTGISSLIGQSEGTMFIDLNLTAWDSNSFYFGLYGGGNEIYFRCAGTGAIDFVHYFGATQAFITKSGLSLGRHKLAACYKNNDWAFYVDGILAGTDTSGTFSGTISQMVFGYTSISAYPPFQSVNQTILFPTRLTNAELASITSL